MRYTLFVCDSHASAQMRSSEDLEALKQDADFHQRIAMTEDKFSDIEYIVKQGYHTVYNAAKLLKKG